jgi:hypothetical protein
VIRAPSCDEGEGRKIGGGEKNRGRGEKFVSDYSTVSVLGHPRREGIDIFWNDPVCTLNNGFGLPGHAQRTTAC